MKLNPNFVLRNIVDEYIVVPICEEADKLHGVITLTESGAFLWEKLAIEQTEDTLVEALLGEYDVDEATARRDVKAFLETIDGIGCVEKQ